MNIVAVLRKEIADVELTGWQIPKRIRITTDALQGSPVTVPFTYERVRVYAVSLAQSGDVVAVADLDAWERWREILIHPMDYESLLKDRDFRMYRTYSQDALPTDFMGLPLCR